MDFEEKIRQICGKAIEDFLASEDCHLYMDHLLKDNKTYQEIQRQPIKKIPVHCTIGINVRIEVLDNNN